MNDLFQDLEMKKELHPKFLVLRDVYSEYHREILNEWFSGFQDRDNKIIKEFQTTFHSSFWEIFLYKVFKELHFKIDFTHNRPDFILEHFGLGEVIYVEATIANISISGSPEDSRGMEDILSMFTPPYLLPDFETGMVESIIRYANAIKSKTEKYRNDYVNCKWICSDNPYVIALSSYSQVNYGREQYVIKQETGAEILLNIFDSKEYEDVSAIIFTSNCTIGKLTALVRSKNEDYNITNVFNLYQDFFDEEVRFKYQDVGTKAPELVTDGLWVFHNPNAKNQLSVLDFWDEGITQIMIEDEKVHMYGNPNPTIARLDVPSITKELVELMIAGELYIYNANVKIEYADYYHHLQFVESDNDKLLEEDKQ